MAELQAHGLAVSTPAGWEGRIFRRAAAGEVAGTATDGSVPGEPAPSSEIVSPVLHVATIPLAADVADYASDAVDELGPTDAIVVLKEFDPAETHTPLFASAGMPRTLDPDWFGPATLQRTLPGQAGLQLFFQENGRAFCLYVVLGAYARRNDVVPSVNAVLATIRIDAPVGSSGAPAPAAPTTTGPTTTAPVPASSTTGATTSTTTPATGPAPDTTTPTQSAGAPR